MPIHEPRDRRVIRRLQHRDRLERHVLLTRPLDLPRRPNPTRIGVQQQGHHHRRVIRPPTNPVTAIRTIKLAQVHPRDRVQHEPSEMTLRQPIPHVGRHQERLITVTTNEILSHPGMVLNAPDDTVITRQPRDEWLVSRAGTARLLRHTQAVASSTECRTSGTARKRQHCPSTDRYGNPRAHGPICPGAAAIGTATDN